MANRNSEVVLPSNCENEPSSLVPRNRRRGTFPRSSSEAVGRSLFDTSASINNEQSSSDKQSAFDSLVKNKSEGGGNSRGEPCSSDSIHQAHTTPSSSSAFALHDPSRVASISSTSHRLLNAQQSIDSCSVLTLGLQLTESTLIDARRVFEVAMESAIAHIQSKCHFEFDEVAEKGKAEGSEGTEPSAGKEEQKGEKRSVNTVDRRVSAEAGGVGSISTCSSASVVMREHPSPRITHESPLSLSPLTSLAYIKREHFFANFSAFFEALARKYRRQRKELESTVADVTEAQRCKRLENESLHTAHSSLAPINFLSSKQQTSLQQQQQTWQQQLTNTLISSDVREKMGLPDDRLNQILHEANDQLSNVSEICEVIDYCGDQSFLSRLFSLIDCSNKGYVSWDEVTSFCLDSTVLAKIHGERCDALSEWTLDSEGIRGISHRPHKLKPMAGTENMLILDRSDAVFAYDPVDDKTSVIAAANSLVSTTITCIEYIPPPMDAFIIATTGAELVVYDPTFTGATNFEKISLPQPVLVIAWCERMGRLLCGDRQGRVAAYEVLRSRWKRLLPPVFDRVLTTHGRSESVLARHAEVAKVKPIDRVLSPLMQRDRERKSLVRSRLHDTTASTQAKKGSPTRQSGVSDSKMESMPDESLSPASASSSSKVPPARIAPSSRNHQRSSSQLGSASVLVSKKENSTKNQRNSAAVSSKTQREQTEAMLTTAQSPDDEVTIVSIEVHRLNGTVVVAFDDGLCQVLPPPYSSTSSAEFKSFMSIGRPLCSVGIVETQGAIVVGTSEPKPEVWSIAACGDENVKPHLLTSRNNRHESPIVAVATFIDTDQCFSLDFMGLIKVWDLRTNAPLQYFRLELRDPRIGWVAMRCSSTGDAVYCCDRQRVIAFRRTDDVKSSTNAALLAKRSKQSATLDAAAAAVSNDPEQHYLVTQQKNAMRQISVEAGDLGENIIFASYSVLTNRIVACSAKKVLFFDPVTGKAVSEADILAATDNTASLMAMMHSSTSQNSSSSRYGKSSTAGKTSSVLKHLLSKKREITAAALDIKGARLFCGLSNGSVLVVNTASGGVVEAYPHAHRGSSVECFAFIDHLNCAVSCGADGSGSYLYRPPPINEGLVSPEKKKEQQRQQMIGSSENGGIVDNTTLPPAETTTIGGGGARNSLIQQSEENKMKEDESGGATDTAKKPSSTVTSNPFTGGSVALHLQVYPAFRCMTGCAVAYVGPPTCLLLAADSEGRIHAFDCERFDPSGANSVSPLFTMTIPIGSDLKLGTDFWATDRDKRRQKQQQQQRERSASSEGAPATKSLNNNNDKKDAKSRSSSLLPFLLTEKRTHGGEEGDGARNDHDPHHQKQQLSSVTDTYDREDDLASFMANMIDGNAAASSPLALLRKAAEALRDAREKNRAASANKDKDRKRGRTSPDSAGARRRGGSSSRRSGSARRGPQRPSSSASSSSAFTPTTRGGTIDHHHANDEEEEDTNKDGRAAGKYIRGEGRSSDAKVVERLLLSDDDNNTTAVFADDDDDSKRYPSSRTISARGWGRGHPKRDENLTNGEDDPHVKNTNNKSSTSNLFVQTIVGLAVFENNEHLIVADPRRMTLLRLDRARRCGIILGQWVMDTAVSPAMLRDPTLLLASRTSSSGSGAGHFATADPLVTSVHLDKGQNVLYAVYDSKSIVAVDVHSLVPKHDPTSAAKLFERRRTALERGRRKILEGERRRIESKRKEKEAEAAQQRQSLIVAKQAEEDEENNNNNNKSFNKDEGGESIIQTERAREISQEVVRDEGREKSRRPTAFLTETDNAESEGRREGKRSSTSQAHLHLATNNKMVDSDDSGSEDDDLSDLLDAPNPMPRWLYQLESHAASTIATLRPFAVPAPACEGIPLATHRRPEGALGPSSVSSTDATGALLHTTTTTTTTTSTASADQQTKTADKSQWALRTSVVSSVTSNPAIGGDLSLSVKSAAGGGAAAVSRTTSLSLRERQERAAANIQRQGRRSLVLAGYTDGFLDLFDAFADLALVWTSSKVWAQPLETEYPHPQEDTLLVQTFAPYRESELREEEEGESGSLRNRRASSMLAGLRLSRGGSAAQLQPSDRRSGDLNAEGFSAPLQPSQRATTMAFAPPQWANNNNVNNRDEEVSFRSTNKYFATDAPDKNKKDDNEFGVAFEHTSFPLLPSHARRPSSSSDGRGGLSPQVLSRSLRNEASKLEYFNRHRSSEASVFFSKQLTRALRRKSEVLMAAAGANSSSSNRRRSTTTTTLGEEEGRGVNEEEVFADGRGGAASTAAHHSGKEQPFFSSIATEEDDVNADNKQQKTRNRSNQSSFSRDNRIATASTSTNPFSDSVALASASSGIPRAGRTRRVHLEGDTLFGDDADNDNPSSQINGSESRPISRSRTERHGRIGSAAVSFERLAQPETQEGKRGGRKERALSVDSTASFGEKEGDVSLSERKPLLGGRVNASSPMPPPPPRPLHLQQQQLVISSVPFVTSSVFNPDTPTKEEDDGKATPASTTKQKQEDTTAPLNSLAKASTLPPTKVPLSVVSRGKAVSSSGTTTSTGAAPPKPAPPHVLVSGGALTTTTSPPPTAFLAAGGGGGGCASISGTTGPSLHDEGLTPTKQHIRALAGGVSHPGRVPSQSTSSALTLLVANEGQTSALGGTNAAELKEDDDWVALQLSVLLRGRVKRKRTRKKRLTRIQLTKQDTLGDDRSPKDKARSPSPESPNTNPLMSGSKPPRPRSPSPSASPLSPQPLPTGRRGNGNLQVNALRTHVTDGNISSSLVLEDATNLPKLKIKIGYDPRRSRRPREKPYSPPAMPSIGMNGLLEFGEGGEGDDATLLFDYKTGADANSFFTAPAANTLNSLLVLPSGGGGGERTSPAPPTTGAAFSGSNAVGAVSVSDVYAERLRREMHGEMNPYMSGEESVSSFSSEYPTTSDESSGSDENSESDFRNASSRVGQQDTGARRLRRLLKNKMKNDPVTRMEKDKKAGLIPLFTTRAGVPVYLSEDLTSVCVPADNIHQFAGGRAQNLSLPTAAASGTNTAQALAHARSMREKEEYYRFQEQRRRQRKAEQRRLHQKRGGAGENEDASDNEADDQRKLRNGRSRRSLSSGSDRGRIHRRNGSARGKASRKLLEPDEDEHFSPLDNEDMRANAEGPGGVREYAVIASFRNQDPRSTTALDKKEALFEMLRRHRYDLEDFADRLQMGSRFIRRRRPVPEVVVNVSTALGRRVLVSEVHQHTGKLSAEELRSAEEADQRLKEESAQQGDRARTANSALMDLAEGKRWWSQSPTDAVPKTAVGGSTASNPSTTPLASSSLSAAAVLGAPKLSSSSVKVSLSQNKGASADGHAPHEDPSIENYHQRPQQAKSGAALVNISSSGTVGVARAEEEFGQSNNASKMKSRPLLPIELLAARRTLPKVPQGTRPLTRAVTPLPPKSCAETLLLAPMHTENNSNHHNKNSSTPYRLPPSRAATPQQQLVSFSPNGSIVTQTQEQQQQQRLLLLRSPASAPATAITATPTPSRAALPFLSPTRASTPAPALLSRLRRGGSSHIMREDVPSQMLSLGVEVKQIPAELFDISNYHRDFFTTPRGSAGGGGGGAERGTLSSSTAALSTMSKMPILAVEADRQHTSDPRNVAGVKKEVVAKQTPAISKKEAMQRKL